MYQALLSFLAGQAGSNQGKAGSTNKAKDNPYLMNLLGELYNKKPMSATMVNGGDQEGGLGFLMNILKGKGNNLGYENEMDYYKPSSYYGDEYTGY